MTISSVYTKSPLKSEDIMYLNCYVKAHKEGQFTINCISVQEAHRIKIALYRAKKKLLDRVDLQADHPEFLSACQDTSISLKKDPDRITMYRTDSSDFNQRLMSQLGMTPEDTKLHEAREIEESQKRLQKLLENETQTGTEEAPKTVNPFADIIGDKPKLSMKELMKQTLEKEHAAELADEAARAEEELRKGKKQGQGK